LFFFFFTFVTGPRRTLSLKSSDARVYEPQIRARLGATAQFCNIIFLKQEKGEWLMGYDVVGEKGLPKPSTLNPKP